MLYLHLLGTDYKTIAKLLDKSPKTIDNALQRIKNKTEKILEKELESCTYPEERLEIVPAGEVIETGEPPVAAIRGRRILFLW